MKRNLRALDYPKSGSVAYGLWGALLALVAVDLIWARYAQISFVSWLPAFKLVGILGGIWLIYGATGRSARLADMGQYATAWIIFGLCGSMLSYCAATLARPLQDAVFAQWDAALGFHWKIWWDIVLSHPILVRMLALFYDSLPAQMFVAIFYFSHYQRPDRNRELVWIALISGVLASLISGVLPARGAFEYFGVPQFAQHLDVLTLLRDGGPHVFALSELKGIITLPSYHTAMAIYFTYAFRGQGWVFYVAAAVNSLMLLSVITHGGHYFVDAIAGAGVAALAIAVTRLSAPRAEADLSARLGAI